MSMDQAADVNSAFFTKTVESEDGTSSRMHVAALGGQWELTVEGSESVQQVLGTVADCTLDDALDMIPGIYEVGSDITRIDCLGIDLHELVGRLKWVGNVDDTRSQAKLPDDFYDIDEIVNDGSISLATNLTLIPSLVKVNRLHLVALSDGKRAGFAVLGEDADDVVITRPVLYQSWETDDSMNSSSGSSEWGYSGPLFWSCSEYGDQHSGAPVIYSAPTNRGLARHAFDIISSEEIYAGEFILSRIGFPDARPEQDIDPDLRLEGSHFSAYLSEQDCDWILAKLLKSRWYASLADGLRDQSTPLGKILYSWASACSRGDEAASEFTLEVIRGYKNESWEDSQTHS